MVDISSKRQGMDSSRSPLGRFAGALKLGAGLLVGGQLCIIDVMHSAGKSNDSPALLTCHLIAQLIPNAFGPR